MLKSRIKTKIIQRLSKAKTKDINELSRQRITKDPHRLLASLSGNFDLFWCVAERVYKMIAIEHQSEIEIYISDSRYLCIKQDDYPGGEKIIAVSPNNIELFLLNLQSVINGEDE